MDQPIPEKATCQEASILSRAHYIPCGAPASAIVYHDGDGRGYYMCAPCADHNVRNRGGKLIVSIPQVSHPQTRRSRSCDRFAILTNFDYLLTLSLFACQSGSKGELHNANRKEQACCRKDREGGRQEENDARQEGQVVKWAAASLRERGPNAHDD